jgi:hypothetical protein
MDEINREADVFSWSKHRVMEQHDLVIIVVVIVGPWKLQRVGYFLAMRCHLQI